MSVPRLNLVVLRVTDLDQSRLFYEVLGLRFESHQHGSGPVHYAHEGQGWVFELYRATAENPVSASTRVGFSVTDLDGVIRKLRDLSPAKVVSEPKESPWGRRAVVADADGHRVELTEG